MLVGICALWPALALAQNPEELFARAVEHLNAGEFERSSEILMQADRLVEDGKLRAKIKLHIGLTEALLGRFEAAKQFFADALALDTTLTVDGQQFGPKIHGLFQSVRGSLRGELDIVTDPPGALVIVDEREVGRSPLRLSLSIGEHVVLLENRKTRRQVTRVVAVEQGRLVSLRVRLSRKRSGKPVHLWTWITAGAAVAAGGLALGLYLAAGAQVEDHDRETDPARREEIEASIRSKELGALIWGGIGAALGATSVVLLIIKRKSSSAGRHAWIAPMLGATTGIAAEGRF